MLVMSLLRIRGGMGLRDMVTVAIPCKTMVVRHAHEE